MGEFHTPSLSREWGDQGREKKRADASMCEVRFATINGHRQGDGACPKCARFRKWVEPSRSADDPQKVVGGTDVPMTILNGSRIRTGQSNRGNEY